MIMISFNVIVMLTCTAITAQANLVNFNLGPDDGVYLDWLCDGKEIRLFKLAHLDILAEKVNKGKGSECDTQVKNAILDLKNVVDANTGNECSINAYQNYTQFYLKYLDRSRRNMDIIKLPKQLVDFALAYGVELSAQCRTNMVKVLLDEGSKVVTSDDFDAVKELIDSDSLIADTLDQTGSGPDELVLPSDLEAVTDKSRQIMHKIGINVATAPMIKHAQRRCELRFKPVYGPMMLPVARFGDLGFEHRNTELKKIFEEDASHAATISKWSRVAFLCEVLEHIELVQDEEDANKAEGSDSTDVFVLTKSNVVERDQVGGTNMLDVVEVDDGDIKPVIFEPKLSVKLQEEILSTDEQTKAVDGIKTSRDEIATIKHRFWMMAMRGLWNEATHLRLGALLNKIFELVKKWMGSSKKEDEDAISTQLVKSMNEVVDREQNLDKPVKLGIIIWYLIVLAILFVPMLISDYSKPVRKPTLGRR